MSNARTLFLPQGNTYLQRFDGFSGATRQWITWEKPAGFSWFLFFLLGGGGGGASGFPSATTTARGGGGGGGSSSQSQLWIPAAMLPPILYLSVGLGGLGGAASTSVSNAGTAGQGSFVGIAANTGAIYTLLLANGGGQGGAGTAAASGAAGTAGAVATRAGMLVSGFGIVDLLAGQAGGAAGPFNTNANAANINYPTTGLMVTGASGGGGGNGGGSGAIAAPASQGTPILITTRPLAVGGTPGARGNSGYQTTDPLLLAGMSIGGSGGGGSSDGTAAGGDGGNGGPGSGGGGGGPGGTAGGGSGGKGGDGLLIITGG